MSLVCLWFVWVGVAYTLFTYGGTLPGPWLVSVAAIGFSGFLYWASSRRTDLGPPPPLALRILLAALLGVAILQLVPLPEGLVRVLSPARAEVHDALVQALGPRPSVTLSLVPAVTFEWVLVVAGLILVFLLAREMAWRWPDRLWMALAPLIALASLQALLGLLQVAAGASLAEGTFRNRNHFAGLMEMVMPFALMAGVAVLRTRRRSHRSPVRPALIACGCFLLAGLMMIAITQSLSRGGYTFALASLFVMGAVALGGFGEGARSARRRLGVLAVAVLVIAGFILLPADPLIDRFAALATTDEVSGDTRVQIWEETLDLVRAYPLTGTGLGGYESGFLRYKTVAPMYTVDYAHNDYLQLLAEWGAVGFGILVVLAVWSFRNAARAAAFPTGTHHRYLGVACLGALTAIALHSLVDYNLYVTGNAAVLVWAAGVADALQVIPLRRHGGRRPDSRRIPTYVESRIA